MGENMSGGFGAVPEELRQAGNAITDVSGGAGGLTWQPPSGDYGHEGVRQGWAQFVEDMREQFEKLRSAADQHGDSLRMAAVEYVEADADSGSTLAGIGAAIDDSGMVGGGWAGPLRNRDLDGDGQAGIMSSRRSRELFPNQDIGSALNPGASDEDQREY